MISEETEIQRLGFLYTFIIRFSSHTETLYAVISLGAPLALYGNLNN